MKCKFISYYICHCLHLQPFLLSCVCVFVLKWWKAFYITAESGPEKRSHSASVGCHRAQDPSSLTASSCTHQCYRGPRFGKSFVFSFLVFLITLNRVVFNVIIKANEIMGRAAASIKNDMRIAWLFSMLMLFKCACKDKKVQKIKKVFSFSDDLPLPLAMPLHTPMPTGTGRCAQCAVPFHCGCRLQILWPLCAPSWHQLCGSGHQHYLPVSNLWLQTFCDRWPPCTLHSASKHLLVV